MKPTELSVLLDQLIKTWENECIEFKQVSNDFDTHKIGEYFSALSNEANLRNKERAWLVFGVDNKTRKVVGTKYRLEAEHLHSLKNQISQSTEPNITFRDIHVLEHPNGRVVLFEIPAAPRGMPIAWKGHYYARAGESRAPLGLDKLDEIRQQTLCKDWTAQIIPEATLTDLDEIAVQRAKEAFAQKHANRFSTDEILNWPVSTFLDRARLTHNKKITRAALLLLGKAEASYYLLPNPAQLTWKLEGQERAYEHFAPPFLLNTTTLYKRIRNIQLRILPQEELLPIEISKYNQKMVLEALHNCIAHQDYERNGRVVVTELPDRLIFENEGNFFEGQPDEYILGDKTPRRYRNPFLTQAMVELNMIDTMGYGIHLIYRGQVKRYLPLPDYDLSSPNEVKMTLYGGVVDPAYSRLLIQKTDLPLGDVLALDRIQKKLTIPNEAVSRLKKAGLIEGRKPNYRVSAIVADVTSDKADYIRTRPMDDKFYEKLLLDYLVKFKQADRSEINKLLFSKLSDALTEEQKTNKISNLITNLRRRKKIRNTGTNKTPCWVLAE